MKRLAKHMAVSLVLLFQKYKEDFLQTTFPEELPTPEHQEHTPATACGNMDAVPGLS